MGKNKQQQSLHVYMNNEIVGTWTTSPVSKFSYSDSWLLSANSRPLSLSLPLTVSDYEFKGPIVESFFDNLLPDSLEIRKRMQIRLGLRTTDGFGILEKVGKDCIGAIQLSPADKPPVNPGMIKGKILSDKDIESILKSRAISAYQNTNEQFFRISLAGAQEKTAFLFHNGQWMLPEGTTPTTHIFKLPLGIIGQDNIDLSDSVENEWLCIRILKDFGLRLPDCSILNFGTEKVLSIKRFDRKFNSDKTVLLRLPQEDMCQATGTSGGYKYESDGGPGIKEILSILNGSLNPAEDREQFFKAQILYWLLAAPDGHAKNFSIFIHPQGRFSLTPFYDVISVYPAIGNSRGKIHPGKIRMAMAVHGGKGKKYHWNKIFRRHWIETAKLTGFAVHSAEKLIDDIINKVPDVINETSKNLPPEFPENISRSIFEGMQKNVDRLKK